MPGRPTGHRTPDTGRRHRTSDTRTPGRPHRTLDTGHRSRGHRTRGHWTSHRTLDAGCCPGPDRLTRYGQLRMSWATPSGCPLGCRTVFLRTAPAALGVPCRLGGDATCQCTKLPLALSGSTRSLRRPSGASAHCSPQTNFGTSVERQAKGQVLWRVHLRAVLSRVEWCRYALVVRTELKVLTALTWSSTGSARMHSRVAAPHDVSA
jgi:hypothetical protein